MAQVRLNLPDDLHKKIKLQAINKGKKVREHYIDIIKRGSNNG